MEKREKEMKLSVDRELLDLWRLSLGLEETVKSIKRKIKRLETARYQDKKAPKLHHHIISYKCSRCGLDVSECFNRECLNNLSDNK